MGLDPGLRTGVKVAVVDGTGKLVATDTIYPHTGQAAKAATVIAAPGEKYHVELVAIGNGRPRVKPNASISTHRKQFPNVTAQKVIVSEAGRPCIPLRSWRRRSFRISTSPRVARFYRASFAGSAGGTGENRSEIDRRRPISTRCQPDAAGA
ncbi:hypothetical protein [Salmonella enterica]|uniref:hypothetical protein n=1 Tax=Salmonella enterica TaxID=28901 RepID=UPI003F4BB18B